MMSVAEILSVATGPRVAKLNPGNPPVPPSWYHAQLYGIRAAAYRETFTFPFFSFQFSRS
jgi:hypothetical protein